MLQVHDPIANQRSFTALRQVINETVNAEEFRSWFLNRAINGNGTSERGARFERRESDTVLLRTGGSVDWVANDELLTSNEPGTSRGGGEWRGGASASELCEDYNRAIT